MHFNEFVASDLRARWITLQVGSSSELLISAYLDPRTKDFAFVEEEERQECLERATSKVLRLAANVILEPRGRHTDGDDADEDSDGYIESPAVRKERAMNERMIRIYGSKPRLRCGVVKKCRTLMRRSSAIPNSNLARFPERQNLPKGQKKRVWLPRILSSGGESTNRSTLDSPPLHAVISVSLRHPFHVKGHSRRVDGL